MLKSIANVLAFLATISFTLSSCGAETKLSDENTPEPKSICVVPRLPLSSNGYKITLEADFISDKMERSLLQDGSCPDIFVTPYDKSNTIKDDGYQAFNRILYANPLQIRLVKAHVKIYGTLKKDRGNRYRLNVIRYIEVSEQKTK